jgi:hypothetical protein
MIACNSNNIFELQCTCPTKKGDNLLAQLAVGVFTNKHRPELHSKWTEGQINVPSYETIRDNYYGLLREDDVDKEMKEMNGKGRKRKTDDGYLVMHCPEKTCHLERGKRLNVVRHLQKAHKMEGGDLIAHTEMLNGKNNQFVCVQEKCKWCSFVESKIKRMK